MLLAAMPIGLWAQDNTWELPEEEQQEELEDAAKGNPDAKYLRGAVPLVDGKVVRRSDIYHSARLHAEDDQGKESD